MAASLYGLIGAATGFLAALLVSSIGAAYLDSEVAAAVASWLPLGSAAIAGALAIVGFLRSTPT